MRSRRAWQRTQTAARNTHADQRPSQQKSASFRALAQTFAAVEVTLLLPRMHLSVCPSSHDTQCFSCAEQQARSTRDKSVALMAACFQSLLPSRQDLTAALFLTAAQVRHACHSFWPFYATNMDGRPVHGFLRWIFVPISWRQRTTAWSCASRPRALRL